MVVSQQTYQIEVLQNQTGLNAKRIPIKMSLAPNFLGHMVASFNLPTTRQSTYGAGGLRAMRLSSSMSKISFKIKKSIQISFLFWGFPLILEIEKFLKKNDVCKYMLSKIHCPSKFSNFWGKIRWNSCLFSATFFHSNVHNNSIEFSTLPK